MSEKKYVYLDKFLIVKLKIQETFKTQKQAMTDLEANVHKNNKKIANLIIFLNALYFIAGIVLMVLIFYNN